MSESPAEAVPGSDAPGVAHGLSPQAVEALLADFRSWLEQTPSPPEDRLDFPALLAQFTALRHEINLQTRAVRAQQEQNGETLRQLALVVEAAQQAQREAAQLRRQQGDELVRPLLNALVELHDALSLAGRELARLQEALGPLLDLMRQPLPAPPSGLSGFEAPPFETPPPSGLARLLGVQAADTQGVERWRQRMLEAVDEALGRHREEFQVERRQREEQLGHASVRLGQLLPSLVTGYAMGLQRVERALSQQGLQPIAAVGRPFDPDQMEALERVHDPAHPPGTVVEEVRRGYLWNGRVFRYAQVRVARA